MNTAKKLMSTELPKDFSPNSLPDILKIAKEYRLKSGCENYAVFFTVISQVASIILFYSDILYEIINEQSGTDTLTYCLVV